MSSIGAMQSELTQAANGANVAQIAQRYQNTELADWGQAAHAARTARFANRVTWARSLHINYSNICEGSCTFCRYRRDEFDADAKRLDENEIIDLVQAAQPSEIHLVGGLDPAYTFERCLQLIGRLRAEFPNVFIKAFTAVEIDYLGRDRQETDVELLTQLRDAGVDCLAGGGAEIFAQRVRDQLCPEKIGGGRWLKIHREAHRLGLASNATMLFGQIETIDERIDHLLQLRRLQAETQGFRAFLPLPAIAPDNEPIDAADALKTLALSRLLLDNVPHIKVFWPIWTVKLAQLAMSFGADDFDGTVGRYEIVSHDQNPNTLTAQQVEAIITAAGFEPIERRGDFTAI